MGPSLDQLSIFVAAARQKSFSATARGLQKAQSAISTAISDLEVDLGVTLFERSGRYPVLTPAGEALLSEAEAILSHRDSLRERANALTRKFESRASIAVEDSFPCAAIAPILATLHRRFPGVEIQLLQPCEEDMLAMVVKSEAMFGLGCARANYPAGVDFCRLGSSTLVNTARRDHPLAQLNSIPFSKLADHLQLVLAAQTTHLLTSEYLKSPKRWLVQSEVALLELLKSGLGWSIVPKRLIAAELASGELVELNLKAYPFTKWTVGLDLIWRNETKFGSVSTWLKAQICRTKVVV